MKTSEVLHFFLILSLTRISLEREALQMVGGTEGHLLALMSEEVIDQEAVVTFTDEILVVIQTTIRRLVTDLLANPQCINRRPRMLLFCSSIRIVVLII